MILNGRGLSHPPPSLPRLTCAPLSSHLNTLTPPMAIAYIHQRRCRFFSGIHCAEQFMMASKARLFGDDSALSATLLQMTPESKNASAVMYATSITISDSKNAKIQPSEATWQNSPRTRKCARPSCTLCPRRLAEASPHDKLWGIGLSACDPESTNASTVMYATLVTTFSKKIANRSSRAATRRHSHKKMRYALSLDILANAASPKLAP